MNQDKLIKLINDASDIVILQADNPDTDSLGSSIALEQILTSLNKNVTMYCRIHIASYLHYLSGWSRVIDSLPNKFDLAIIVDTSSISLMDKLSDSDKKRLSKSEVVIIDHHPVESTIDFATLTIIEEASSTGEIIYKIAKDNDWKLNAEASSALASSILADSLGLTSKSTTAKTIRIIADLVESGVDLNKLDSIRKESYRKSLELTKYKGQLLERLETYLDGRLVVLTIPWEEIEKYSPIYNPSMLVMEDMRLVDSSAVAIAFKIYNDGKITAKIRSNSSYPISNKLAKIFGGDGHDYASGFKTYDYKDYNELLKKVIEELGKLLGDNHATV